MCLFWSSASFSIFIANKIQCLEMAIESDEHFIHATITGYVSSVVLQFLESIYQSLIGRFSV